MEPLANRFAGKVVVVTGAASGIGAATAARFAAEGATVVGADRVEFAADGVDAVVADVTDEASVAGLIERAASHGGIDVVANVAGVEQFGPFAELTVAEWRRTLDVNLTGPFLVTHAALPHLRDRRGAVVNVASVSGITGTPLTAAYCASKGGLVLLTRALAVELAADKVRVSCVCPGGVDTPLIARVADKLPSDMDPMLFARMQSPLRGLTKPDDVAEAIAYLAAARRVSGAVLTVDGAQTA